MLTRHTATWPVLMLTTTLLLPGRAEGQEVVVRPESDSPHFDAARVPRGQWLVNVRIERDGKLLAERSYHWKVAPTSWEGRAALLSVQWVDGPQGGIDSTLVDAATLAPLAFRARNPAGTDSVDFRGTRVSANVARGGASQARQSDLAEPGFDASVIDLVYSGLVLRDGFSGQVAVLSRNYQDHSYSTQRESVRVTAPAAAGGPWLVRVDGAQGVRTMEVDGTTREIARMTIEASNGARVSVTRVREAP